MPRIPLAARGITRGPPERRGPSPLGPRPARSPACRPRAHRERPRVERGDLIARSATGHAPIGLRSSIRPSASAGGSPCRMAKPGLVFEAEVGGWQESCSRTPGARWGGSVQRERVVHAGGRSDRDGAPQSCGRAVLRSCSPAAGAMRRHQRPGNVRIDARAAGHAGPRREVQRPRRSPGAMSCRGTLPHMIVTTCRQGRCHAATRKVGRVRACATPRVRPP